MKKLAARTPYLTVGQIAKTLKVHDVTVRRWIRDGKLQAMVVGNRYRVKPEWVDSFQKQNMRQAG